MKAPCKDCAERHMNCHPECERYITYSDWCKEMSQLKVQRNPADDYRLDRTLKIKNRRSLAKK